MQKNVIIGHVFQPKDIINIINLFNQNLLAQQQKAGDKDENMQDESNMTIQKSIISTEYGTNPSISPQS